MFKKYLKNHLLICVTALILVFSTIFSMAWFGIPKRTGSTEYLGVKDPPILYILNNKAEDMTVLNLDGIVVGQKNDIVFCVSSVPDIDDPIYEGSSANFAIEIAYTNNLGADIDLYSADYSGVETPADTTDFVEKDNMYYKKNKLLTVSQDISADANAKAYNDDDIVQINNRAKYLLYKSDNQPDALVFKNPTGSVTNQLYNTNKVRFFVLEISWSDTVPDTSAKEADMIYVMASGNLI